MNKSDGKASNKSVKKIITFLLVFVLSVFLVVLIMIKKNENPLSNVSLDTNTIQILDSLGDDDRVDDFLKIYGILRNVDLTDAKKTNTQKLQIDKISEKWNIETAKLNPYTTMNVNTIHFFYELVTPAYYEKAPFQKNSLNIDVDRLVNQFQAQGFRYNKEADKDLAETAIRYYKTNELVGPYCSLRYHNKDKAVEYVSLALFNNQRKWSATQMEAHLNQALDEQVKDMIYLAMQDLDSYIVEGEHPILNGVFTDEEIAVLNWFLYQLNSEQLRAYDVLNNDTTVDCLGIWIPITLNDKAGILGFGLNGIDISVQRIDGYASEFEKHLHSLKQAFWDEPDVIIENDELNLIDLYRANENSKSESPGLNFVGQWQDSYSQRASLKIENKNEVYSLMINWGISAAETMQWRMTGTYSSGEKTGVISQDCTKVRIYSKGTEILEEVIYTEGEAFFYIQNGILYWEDFTEQIGDKCTFEKFE